MISSKYITYQDSKLHYVKAGSGKDVLLFFHGFGQDHSVYLPLIQSLANQYQLYIFDLFFHGQSTWSKNEKPLKKAEWKSFIELLIHQEKLDNFSVVGYSLGGKFALSIIELFSSRVKHAYLIAPDGIKTSFWYSMATYPIILRRLFRSMINKYHRFEAITKFLDNNNLVDKGLLRFADYQMGTEEKRKRVYYSWVVFRHLSFNMKRLGNLFNQNNIGLTIITGKYDKVIEPKNMHNLLQHVKDYRFEILEAGHNGLIQQSLPYIRR